VVSSRNQERGSHTDQTGALEPKIRTKEELARESGPDLTWPRTGAKIRTWGRGLACWTQVERLALDRNRTNQSSGNKRGPRQQETEERAAARTLRAGRKKRYGPQPRRNRIRKEKRRPSELRGTEKSSGSQKSHGRRGPARPTAGMRIEVRSERRAGRVRGGEYRAEERPATKEKSQIVENNEQHI
jgi:hypothetical protein